MPSFDIRNRGIPRTAGNSIPALTCFWGVPIIPPFTGHSVRIFVANFAGNRDSSTSGDVVLQ